MATNVSEEVMQTLEVLKDEHVAAPIDIVFETILEQMGPYNETPDGVALAMKIEAWPGGRWFRDLGGNSGHLWGHVQSIKAPTLLEICGPLFMSGPAMNNVQYRLTAEGNGTRIQFVHRGMGQIDARHREGVSRGWGSLLDRIKAKAEGKNKGGKS